MHLSRDEGLVWQQVLMFFISSSSSNSNNHCVQKLFVLSAKIVLVWQFFVSLLYQEDLCEQRREGFQFA